MIEDDPNVAEVVATYLEREGCIVEVRDDGEAGLAAALADPPDLVVLDLMLPGLDGLEVCRRLQALAPVPVVMLTAKGDETDRIVGLELGADDYISKPFSPRELVARVRTVLRRAQFSPTAPDALHFEGLLLDLRAREVLVDERPVALTAKEFDLLAFLAQAPRQVFSRAQLLHHVWDSSPDFQDPATVTVHVRRLRNKIEANPEHARWITTVWGVGYRFEP